MADILYKPKELYEKSLKNQFHNEVTNYFDNLVKESKVDEEANRKHVAELKETEKEYQSYKNKLDSKKNLKTFLIVLTILSFALAMVFALIYLANEAWYYALIAVLFMATGVGLIVLIATKIKKQAKELSDKAASKEEDCKKAMNRCLADMEPLNNSFDWNIPQKILEKATPIIDIEPYFSAERMDFMSSVFGFKERDDGEKSTLQVLAGNIQGNPFIEEKHIAHEMGEKVYTGTLVIHWTETYYDKDGHAHNIHHTQTLTARVKHDCPYYTTITSLIYANEAAPHLSFSRSSSGINTMDEKERAKFLKNRMKKISKQAEEAVKKGKDFTPTGNDEFDAFFGGEDRNNEVEFRLLFTPLAEANMLELIKDKQPFGDDFSLYKIKKLNLVISDHSQKFDYSASPYYFKGHDIDEMRTTFTNYCDNFIKYIYFDLAPILSIPLYQMHKPYSFTYQKEYPSNYSSYEHQAMINSFSFDVFAPKEADPDVPLIIQSEFEKKIGDTDVVEVKSFGYMTSPMTDFVQELGGDGFVHSVPVHWTQYDLVKKKGEVGIKYLGCSLQKFKKSLSKLQDIGLLNKNSPFNFERGFLIFTKTKDYTLEIDKEITSIFSDKNVA